jgi:hypothetical protein
MLDLSYSVYPDLGRVLAAIPRRLAGGGQRVAFIARPPKLGSIRDVIFRLHNFVTPVPILVSLQGVDPATGLPNGVADQSGTVPEDVVRWSWRRWVTATMSADRVVADITEPLAVVFELSPYVDGTIEVLVNPSPLVGNAYCAFYDGAAWTKLTTGPMVFFRYSDGSYGKSLDLPHGLHYYDTMNSGSTPNERGAVFQLPTSVRTVGAEWLGSDTDGDVVVTLYSESDQVLAQAALPGALLTGQNAMRPHRVTWESPVTLQANTTYRLSFRATTTASMRFHYAELPSNAAMDQLPGGRLWYGTRRTFGGAWTDEPDRRYNLGLILDGVAGGKPRLEMSRTVMK